MKIVQFIASKGWGGAEDSFIELCNILSQTVQVEVILLKENQIAQKLDKSVKIHTLSSGSGRYNPFLYIELAKLLKEINPDIVHTHSAKAAEIIHRLSVRFPLRQVATKHNPRKGKIFNKLTHVIAISKEVADSMEGKRAEIIYNGLPKVPNLFPRKKNDTPFTISAIGRLDKVKGFDTLVKEAAKLSFPYHLHIIGEGEERDRLEKLIIENRISSCVTLNGFRNDIPSVIASSDLVVVSSLSEGFGRVIVETLFYGKVLISTNVGIAAEILPEQLLVKEKRFAEKIEEVYHNSEEYEKLFAEVKETYQKQFSLEEKAREYIAYYQRILTFEEGSST